MCYRTDLENLSFYLHAIENLGINKILCFFFFKQVSYTIHLFDQKYRKNSDTMKYYFYILNILTYFKI